MQERSTYPWVEDVLAFVGCVVFAGLAGLVILFIWTTVTWGHGPADWINQGQHKNGLGELCCGERDCFELADGDVRITPAGYFVVSINEVVPFHQATPSPDGRYWRCQWGGARKCFFAPPGST